MSPRFTVFCKLILAGLLVSGCAHQQPTAVVDQSTLFADFLESIYQRRLADSPELAASLGEKSGQDRWDDRSAKGNQAEVRQYWLDLRTLHGEFDYDRLNPAQQLNYRVFEAELKLRIKRHAWRYHVSPVNQIVGLHLQIPGLLTKYHGIDSLADAHAYIARVRTAGIPITQFIETLQAREQAGFLLARSLLPRLVQSSESIISGGLGEGDNANLVYADFQEKIDRLSISTQLKEELRISLGLALEQHFFPAYQDLIRVFKAQLAGDVNDKGVWQYPDGADFYQFLLQQYTTTPITADELHKLGLQEVARIHADMRAIKDEVGRSGDLPAFFRHLEDDPRFYYPDNDAGRAAYLQEAEQFVDRARQEVVNILPDPLHHPVIVRRIEAYREKSAPVGFYEAGSEDGSSPGTVFLGMYDMSSAASYDLGALLSHEGIPGHHLQLSLMYSQDHIPAMRKHYVWWLNAAFTEGWALYAEYLAEELGLYSDPYSRFGRLAGELWRACRLVVDSGLHAKRWSRQQAIDYLNDNTASSEENNVRAVDRYLAVPGQATAFKIGMMKILELRQMAQEKLGDKFDTREFHHTVLKNGPIPLSLVEEEVLAWIAGKT